MNSVGVIYKLEDRLVAGTAKQLIKELQKKGYKINLADPQFVITLGGDATVLRAARKFSGRGTPILAVHMGGVGFLTEIELEEINAALEKIKKKKYFLDERMMIEASVGGKKLTALNDIVISKSGIARVIKLEVEGINEYIADGLVFSTATGSTAYNLSVGGPILTPASKGIIISAICPHSMSARPIVVEDNLSVVLNRGDQVIVTADGQQMVPLKVGQRVKVERSKLKAKFIRFKKDAFFKRLEETFGF